MKINIMRTSKTLVSLIVMSLTMFLHLLFVQFVFADACFDRGGRFLFSELMCESETGYSSFSLSLEFYALTCVAFGIVAVSLLKLLDRLTTILEPASSKSKAHYSRIG